MSNETALATIAKTLMLGHGFDYTSIAVKLMEHDPMLFLKLAGVEIVRKPWAAEAIELANTSGGVACIRAIRAGTGMGLWEAKQVYDAWRNDGTWQCDSYRVTDQMKVTLREMM